MRVLQARARPAAAAAVAVVIAVTARCALQPLPASASDVDRTLRQSTYYEEGDLVALVVGARPARFRLSEPFIPLEVAVVNRGLESLTITPESFTLVAQDGQRYPMASRAELSRLYGSTDRDRVLAEAEEALRGRYASYRRIPANLTPSFDRPVARDRVSLPRFAWMYDFLYFPRPDDPAIVEPLELFVRAPELADPVFVRFLIPVPKGKRDEIEAAR
jgi:hypothetical protein